MGPTSNSLGGVWWPQAHKQMSQAEPKQPAPAVVHGCWQMDADERVLLAGYGRAYILNIVDHTNGLKIGNCPDRIRTDRDRIIVPANPAADIGYKMS